MEKRRVRRTRTADFLADSGNEERVLAIIPVPHQRAGQIDTHRSDYRDHTGRSTWPEPLNQTSCTNACHPARDKSSPSCAGRVHALGMA